MYVGGARRADRNGEGIDGPGPGSHSELPGLREVAQTSEWRCVDWAPLSAGLAFGQHLLHAEAAHRFRPDSLGDPSVLERVAFPHPGTDSEFPPNCTRNPYQSR